MNALAILTPTGAVPRFPSRLCRVWLRLYKGRGSGTGITLGSPASMAFTAVLFPFYLMWRTCVVTYGTVLWLMWCYTVFSAWLFVAMITYPCYVIVRTAEYLRNRNSEG